MEERRAEARMMCADVVQVSWTGEGGRPGRATALLEDISRYGTCIQLERELPLGTELTIHHPKTTMKGTVRYCVYREIGYFVGIELAPESHWSRSKFTPRHLLDLERLVLRSAKKATKRRS